MNLAFRILASVGMLLATLSCQLDQEVPVSKAIETAGIDGVWYFQGGVLPADWPSATTWPDTRLVIDAKNASLTYFWHASNTNLYDWTTDSASQSEKIRTVKGGLISANVTVAAQAGNNASPAAVGDETNMYFRIVEGELHWWWYDPSKSETANDWTHYIIYKKTRPVAP